jgi:hypothetical protein
MGSIQGFITDLKTYKKNVLDVRERAEIAALKELEEKMKVRIFDKSKGTDLQDFGTYRSQAYKALRESKGRQIGTKDLQFSGEFKKSMTVGKNQGRNVLGFTNDPNDKIKDRSATIREGQEKGSKTRYGVPVKQIGFDIFTPNEFEIDEAFQRFVEVIDLKLAELNNV